ncbi:kinase-like domain-containing protein [Mycena latifolia]|nr:kinase-like domain-containing protein [Mycena latifolia]
MRPSEVPPRLSQQEEYWRNHQLWLKECGYMLRPRFRHDWIPSWEAHPEWNHFIWEDGITLSPPQIIDATRISDGTPVALKLISRSVHPNEAKIWEYFSSPELASDPRNHCLPLLEQLSPPDDPDRLIFVMKLMRKFDSPRFDTFGEVVECLRQVFEAVQFMHQHRVAHRDCTRLNIMMDAQHLYPQGYHPSYDRYLPTFPRGRLKSAKYYTRTQRPVRYYLIDFGISCKFEPGEETRADVIEGGDHSAPEFGNHELRDVALNLDPFPTDIYYLGNLIRMEFLVGEPLLGISPKLGFDFIKPLVGDMVQDDPSKRPTIDEVVARFEKIQRGLSSWKLRSRVVKTTESPWHLIRRTSHLLRRIGYILRRVPAIPRPPES